MWRHTWVTNLGFGKRYFCEYPCCYKIKYLNIILMWFHLLHFGACKFYSEWIDAQYWVFNLDENYMNPFLLNFVIHHKKQQIQILLNQHLAVNHQTISIFINEYQAGVRKNTIFRWLAKFSVKTTWSPPFQSGPK